MGSPVTTRAEVGVRTTTKLKEERLLATPDPFLGDIHSCDLGLDQGMVGGIDPLNQTHNLTLISEGGGPFRQTANRPIGPLTLGLAPSQSLGVGYPPARSDTYLSARG